MEQDRVKYVKRCQEGQDRCIRLWNRTDETKVVLNKCEAQMECKNLQKGCDEMGKADGKMCRFACCSTEECNASSVLPISMFLVAACTLLILALLK